MIAGHDTDPQITIAGPLRDRLSDHFSALTKMSGSCRQRGLGLGNHDGKGLWLVDRQMRQHLAVKAQLSLGHAVDE
jgi:hypothetical protein